VGTKSGVADLNQRSGAPHMVENWRHTYEQKYVKSRLVSGLQDVKIK